MAGKIVADTLEHSTAGSVDTQYVVNGSAKSWVQFDQSDNGVDGSLNVSSVTDNGVGDITNNFTNSFSASNYANSGFGGFDNYAQTVWVGGASSVAIGTWKATGSLRSHATYTNNTKNTDVKDFSLVHFGDLA